MFNVQPRYLTSRRPHSSSHPGQPWPWKSVGWLQCLDQSLRVVEHTASPASLYQTPEDKHKDWVFNEALFIQFDVLYQIDLNKRSRCKTRSTRKRKGCLTCCASRKSLYLMRARGIWTFAYSESLADGVIWKAKHHKWDFFKIQLVRHKNIFKLVFGVCLLCPFMHGCMYCQTNMQKMTVY